MPDVIYPVERALIDARVEAGLYTVCPPGARADGSWDYGEPVPLREQIRRQATAGMAEAARGARRREALEARRDQVVVMHAAGVSTLRIAQRFGIAPKTVENDLTALRKAGRV